VGGAWAGDDQFPGRRPPWLPGPTFLALRWIVDRLSPAACLSTGACLAPLAGLVAAPSAATDAAARRRDSPCDSPWPKMDRASATELAGSLRRAPRLKADPTSAQLFFKPGGLGLLRR